ncbi:MAG: 4Fe-4S binding protein [Defluviitaleaceae bacterium]|nr:4Fe-4S binding protein [Defluviitaleaceae bacterium]
MINELKSLAESKGDRLAVVSIERLTHLQAELAEFRATKQLNDYQKWIFDEIYRFGPIPPQMKSIIIVAVPRPLYARVTFSLDGKEYKAFAPVFVPAEKTDEYIERAVKNAGYGIEKATRLPLKRLAVQSGLAEYGRNNIAYVSGMGSALSLRAFLTEMPCDEDIWRGPVVSPKCDTCGICVRKCPTGALSPDDFLSDGQKCLTALQQSEDHFPEWLPHTAHHTHYYCLMCQARCPLNVNQKTIEASFNHQETQRLLAGLPYDDVTGELKEKIDMLGFGAYKTVPRNLRALFDAMDKGHVPIL